MKTFELKKEEIKLLYNTGTDRTKQMLESKYGKDFFISEEITGKVKSFEDASAVIGIDPASVFHNSDSKDEIAYKKLKVIARALNEGWEPDWDNSAEYKYYPWFDMRSSSGSGFASYDYVRWYSDSCAGSRLCFKSKELAEYAGKQFLGIYKEFMCL